MDTFIIYSNSNICVKINGVLTDSFALERSVRQGCLLSALLYSIATEPLARLIKRDEEIRGIQMPHGGMSIIHQYADDTTFPVKDIESIYRVYIHRVVRTARHIVGGELPSLQDIYTRRCVRKARRIIKDSSHPSHSLLSLLPSGRRLRSIRSRTSRLRDSFFPQAIRLMNSKN